MIVFSIFRFNLSHLTLHRILAVGMFGLARAGPRHKFLGKFLSPRGNIAGKTSAVYILVAAEGTSNFLF